MNYTQNEKIEQVTDTTMVVGIDIGSQTHFARAFDKNNIRSLASKIPSDVKYYSDTLENIKEELLSLRNYLFFVTWLSLLGEPRRLP